MQTAQSRKQPKRNNGAMEMHRSKACFTYSTKRQVFKYSNKRDSWCDRPVSPRGKKKQNNEFVQTPLAECPLLQAREHAEKIEPRAARFAAIAAITLSAKWHTGRRGH